MRLANLNLQADAARRVQHDSDVTLVNATISNPERVSDDSETEGEDDTRAEDDEATTHAPAEVQVSKGRARAAEKEMAPGKKEKTDGRRKSLKETFSKAAFTAFSGSVPKRRGPEFAIYPI